MSDHPTGSIRSTSDDMILVACQALAAAEMEHPECMTRFLSRLHPRRLRKLGEIMDTVSQAAFTLAGPYPDFDQSPRSQPELLAGRTMDAPGWWHDRVRQMAERAAQLPERAPSEAELAEMRAAAERVVEVDDLGDLYPDDDPFDVIDRDVLFGPEDDGDEGGPR